MLLSRYIIYLRDSYCGHRLSGQALAVRVVEDSRGGTCIAHNAVSRRTPGLTAAPLFSTVQEEEKNKIQNDLRILTERLSRINESLARKVNRAYAPSCAPLRRSCPVWCYGLSGCEWLP